MIIKFTSLTCCLLLIFNLAIAQSDTIQWHSGVKLKFGDFSIDRSTTHIFADVAVHYEYSFQPSTFGKYLPLVKANAILNRQTATLPDSSENALRYAQLLFDLSGYHARLIEWRVFELGELHGFATPLKTSVDNAISQAHHEASLLKKEMIEHLSQHNNELALGEWESRISNLLENTPEIVEERRPAKLHLGIFVGATRSIFTGKTSNYFTDATGLNFGFNIDIKKSRLVLDTNLDFNKAKQELESKGYWPAGMKTHFASGEITYGIKILKNKWLTVPFAGYSINEFTPAKSDKDDKRRIVGYSPVIGFEVSRYFGNQRDSYEEASFFYKLRASVNPSNMIKNYAGTQINLKLAIGFDISRVRSRWVKKM